jgi:hypothetical protein
LNIDSTKTKTSKGKGRKTGTHLGSEITFTVNFDHTNVGSKKKHAVIFGVIFGIRSVNSMLVMVMVGCDDRFTAEPHLLLQLILL